MSPPDETMQEGTFPDYISVARDVTGLPRVFYPFRARWFDRATKNVTAAPSAVETAPNDAPRTPNSR